MPFSFGEGHANYMQVILESPRQYGLPEPTHVNGVLHGKNAHDLLLFSAYNPKSLESQVAIYQDYVEKNKISVRDLAYSLANRRESRPCRAFVVANDSWPWQISSYETVSDSSPGVAWVFTGQGAQWPGMGARLLDANPTFRNTIRKLDGFIRTLPVSLSWTIEGQWLSFKFWTFTSIWAGC
jgi:acyl transferase domain-containing protein